MGTIPYKPTGRPLLPKIQELHLRIKEAKRALDDCYKDLERACEDCPHEHVIHWTNNDGDGQFIVERCEDCGLQKDGGIPKK